MIQRFFFILAAADAALHVQLEILRVSPPDTSPGQAKVEGRIARVFRGDAGLMGTLIEVGVHCLRKGEHPPPSGILWSSYDELAKARVLEAYLDRVDGQYLIAQSQSTMLAALTDRPAITYSAEEIADARKRAQPDPWQEAPRKLSIWVMYVSLIGAALWGLYVAARALLR